MRPSLRSNRSAVVHTAALSVLLLLAGCANQPPVTLGSQYTPQSRLASPPSYRNAGDAAPVCRLRIGEVHDLRIDPQSMGAIGWRPIRASDPVAWLRSGLLTLGQDKRIAIVEADAELEISAEMMKAYVLSQNTQKSANVVVRVHYAQQGQALDDAIYRGTDVGMNWASGSEESQGAMDRALGDLLKSLDKDLVTRCKALKAN